MGGFYLVASSLKNKLSDKVTPKKYKSKEINFLTIRRFCLTE